LHPCHYVQRRFYDELSSHICCYIIRICTVVTTPYLRRQVYDKRVETHLSLHEQQLHACYYLNRKFYDRWLSHICCISSSGCCFRSSCKIVTIANQSFGKMFPTTGLHFIFSNKSGICFLKTNDDDSISLTRT
jgi:hypothetical protein